MKQFVLKYASLAMALCMMVTFAAGCGGDPTDPDDPKKTTTTASRSGDENSDSSEDDSSKTNNKSTTTKADKDRTRTGNKTTTTTKGGEEQGIITDLKGATITVAGLDNCYFALNASKNEWNRQIRNQLTAIEKSLNCKFKLVKYKTTDDLATNCVKAHRAKTKFSDIMVAPLHLQKKLVAGKSIQNLNAVKGLDLSKSYWDQNARKEMKMYGKNFAAFTTLDGTAANANVIYFNKVLAKQIGTSDTELYKMVKNGTWTFSAMQNLSSKARKDIDGKAGYGDNDQYGFGGVDLRGGVSYSIFKAQGGYFTKTSGTGDITFALDEAKNIKALRGMQSWLLKDNSVYNPDKKENDWSKTQKAFTEGRLLFMGWSADAATNFTEMKNDWGVLPYPMAEKGGKYISVISWNTQGFSIPSQVKKGDLVNAASVLDAIARQFDKIKDNKRAYNKSRVYRDSQTQEMLDIAAAGASIDFCQFGELGEGGLTCIHYLFNSISNDPATVVKSRKENAVSALNTFLKAVK